MQLVDLLREMCMIPALSGHEEKMIRYMQSALAPHADEVSVDKSGNVIARFTGRDPHAPRVMIFAHMDQPGFVVRKIEEDGFVRLERVGGIPERVLPGLRVLIETETGSSVSGVIGVKSHHVTPINEKYVVVPYRELYVDIGAGTGQEVNSLGIEVGCPVVYHPHFELLAERRISATSVDDRAGCAVLIKLAELAAERRPRAALCLVGTVQEEFNLRGAMLAAAAVTPDIAICLDIAVSGDTPDLGGLSSIRLGGGPVMGMYSFHGRGTLNGTIPHPRLVRMIQRVAAERGIPLQRSAILGALTDSSYVQLVGRGIPVIDLGFATRYTHTPVETCELADLEQLVSLVWATVQEISHDFEASRV